MLACLVTAVAAGAMGLAGITLGGSGEFARRFPPSLWTGAGWLCAALLVGGLLGLAVLRLAGAGDTGRARPRRGRALRVVTGTGGSGRVADGRRASRCCSGFAISAEIFTPVLPLYAEHFRSITFDNRGPGRSSTPLVPTWMAELAAGCAHVCTTKAFIPNRESTRL